MTEPQLINNADGLFIKTDKGLEPVTARTMFEGKMVFITANGFYGLNGQSLTHIHEDVGEELPKGIRMPKAHRYPPFEHNFDDLCDAGCGRPVPEHMSSMWLEQLGWVVRENADYTDGWEKICPVCVLPATPDATPDVKPTVEENE